MTEVLTDSQLLPQQPYMNAGVGMAEGIDRSVYQGPKIHSIHPSYIRPGNIVKVMTCMRDIGNPDRNLYPDRHLSAVPVFSLGPDEFNYPTPATLEVVVEEIDRADEVLSGLIINRHWSFDYSGTSFGFPGLRLEASFGELGMTPLRYGHLWSPDTMTILQKESLCPTSLTQEQRQRIGAFFKRLEVGARSVGVTPGEPSDYATLRLEAEASKNRDLFTRLSIDSLKTELKRQYRNVSHG